MMLHFTIDPSHLEGPFGDRSFIRSLAVELTEREFRELCHSKRLWELFPALREGLPPVTDDEPFLRRMLPDIHQRVREVLRQSACELWGRDILPHLKAVDIYLPAECYTKGSPA